jgi:hypothetical protein
MDTGLQNTVTGDDDADHPKNEAVRTDFGFQKKSMIEALLGSFLNWHGITIYT